ncbi:TIGR03086 family protein [Kribbella qitaiheensis]|uniref:TIGR03086 family protein n=1 Tax=Kribbella qitaiheensis TaxID=1544730 RepID=A0A7G6X752_9ACTN|nr:TIGR03086 family metal-binding protein [Kribbella qitaiheensis]QNE22067.1 TIGR03086 family protein [Kribbella qitaiheensis]
MDIFETATAEFERIVAALPSDSWGNATPCDVTVREVVGHVAGGNLFAVRLLAGASAADAVAGLDDPLGDNPLSAVQASGADQLAAFAAADKTLPLHHPSGDISYDTFVRFRLGELVVHAWDLTIGAHLDPTLDNSVVDALWTMVEPHLGDMQKMNAFGDGPSGTLPPKASPQSRLLDAFGRRP